LFKLLFNLKEILGFRIEFAWFWYKYHALDSLPYFMKDWVWILAFVFRNESWSGTRFWYCDGLGY